MKRRLQASILAALCLAPLPGRASSCDAAASLAAIHDAYLALGRETGHLRQDAALALLALHLPAANPDAISGQLSNSQTPPDPDRLRQAFTDAADAARSVLGNDKAPSGAQLAANTSYLANIILASGCVPAWAGAAPTTNEGGPSGQARPGSIASAPALTGPLLLALAIAAVLAILRLRRSRPFRRRQLPRLPRTPVRLDAMALFPGGSRQPVQVLDLSLGGMKIALAGAPPPGAALEITVGDHALAASIAWRNEFYAGLLFDIPLPPAELERLIALSAARSGGKPGQASRSAAAPR
jgi:hypothetical protein